MVYEPATTGVVTVTINKYSFNLFTELRNEDASWKGMQVEYDGEEKSVDVTKFAFPSDIIDFASGPPTV